MLLNIPWKIRKGDELRLLSNPYKLFFSIDMFFLGLYSRVL